CWSLSSCTPPPAGWSGRSRAWSASNEPCLPHQRPARARALRLSPVRIVQAGEVLMTPASLGLLAVFLLVTLACVKPVGLYLANVMEGRPIWPLRVGARLEAFIYRLCGIDPQAAMGWKTYALALLLFNTLGGLAVYALQRLQLWLPFNPQHFVNVSPDS